MFLEYQLILKHFANFLETLLIKFYLVSMVLLVAKSRLSKMDLLENMGASSGNEQLNNCWKGYRWTNVVFFRESCIQAQKTPLHLHGKNSQYRLNRGHWKQSMKKQPSEVFCKKGVLRNLTKFTGKHLCQSLFFNKVAGLRPDSGTSVFLWILLKF